MQRKGGHGSQRKLTWRAHQQAGGCLIRRRSADCDRVRRHRSEEEAQNSEALTLFWRPSGSLFLAYFVYVLLSLLLPSLVMFINLRCFMLQVGEVFTRQGWELSCQGQLYV